MVNLVTQCVRTLCCLLCGSYSFSLSPRPISLFFPPSLSSLQSQKHEVLQQCLIRWGREAGFRQRKKSSYNISIVTASADPRGTWYDSRVVWYGQHFILPHWSLIRYVPPLWRKSQRAKQPSLEGVILLPDGANN